MPHGANIRRAVPRVAGLIAAATLLAGCHQFPFDRGQRLSERLGLPAVTPPAVADLESSDVHEREIPPRPRKKTEVAAAEPDAEPEPDGVVVLPERRARTAKRDAAVTRAVAVTPLDDTAEMENEDAPERPSRKAEATPPKRLPGNRDLGLVSPDESDAAPTAAKAKQDRAEPRTAEEPPDNAEMKESNPPKEEAEPESARGKTEASSRDSAPQPAAENEEPLAELPKPEAEPDAAEENAAPSGKAPDAGALRAAEPAAKPARQNKAVEPAAADPADEAAPQEPEAPAGRSPNEAAKPGPRQEAEPLEELPPATEATTATPAPPRAPETEAPAPAAHPEPEEKEPAPAAPDPEKDAPAAPAALPRPAEPPSAPVEPASRPEEVAPSESASPLLAARTPGESPAPGDGELRESSPEIAPRRSWDETVAQLRSMARERLDRPDANGPEDWPLRAQLLEELASLKPGERPSPRWQAVLKALHASERPDAPNRSSEIRAAVDVLEEQVPLEIGELQLCRKVSGFGNVLPLARNASKAGHPVIVYSEMSGVRYERADGSFRSRLASQVELVDPKTGECVWKESLGTAEDTCRHRRRDYYVNYRITPPSTVAPGHYELRLTQTDLVASRSVTASIPLEISP